MFRTLLLTLVLASAPLGVQSQNVSSGADPRDTYCGDIDRKTAKCPYNPSGSPAAANEDAVRMDDTQVVCACGGQAINLGTVDPKGNTKYSSDFYKGIEEIRVVRMSKVALATFEPSDVFANFNGSGTVAAPVSWTFEIDDLIQKCPEPGYENKRLEAINRRIVWSGLNNVRVSMLANVQYIYEFMDHEGVGYYHGAEANQCGADGRGVSDPTKNCVFAHNTPGPNWVEHDSKKQGQTGNMAISVEAYKHPFATEYNRAPGVDRLTIEADLNSSCLNFGQSARQYNKGKFPGFKLHVDMDKSQFKTYKETFEITDFP